MKKLLFTLLCLFALTGVAQEISLIPQPAEMKVNEGKFLFRGKVVLCYPKIKDSGIDAAEPIKRIRANITGAIHINTSESFLLMLNAIEIAITNIRGERISILSAIINAI